MKLKRFGVKSGKYKPLSGKDVKRIHETSLKVMEEVGFEINSPESLKKFEVAGADVNHDNGIVKISPEKVMENIKKAPYPLKLYARERKYDLTLGGTRVYMGTGGTALNVIDYDTGECRPATLEDLKKIASLVEELENVHFLLLPTYPNDIEKEDVDVNRFFAGFDNTSKHIMGGVYTLDGVRKVIGMAEKIAGDPERLRKKPFLSMITCGMSPLKLDATYSELLMYIAGTGVPVCTPSEPLCGATGPASLAGNIVIQNVDSLIGVILAQIVNPGTPVIYGSIASNVDPRDYKYLSGSIEVGLMHAAIAQMAQFYKLPHYSTGGMSDSKTVDAQCGYEAALTGILPALAGANFIHDAAGLMEFAMSVSLEKYVVDNEIIGQIMRAAEGIRVDDDSLAFDIIKSVGPGGNFVSEHHTVKNIRSEHYMPGLSDREIRQNWEENGKKDTYKRANEKVQQILAGSAHSKINRSVRKNILQDYPEILA